MRKLYTVLGAVGLVLIAGASVLLVYISTALPNVSPAPDIQIERTAERIEKGKHLANTVMACMHCHTPQEKTKFAHPIKADMLGAGGVLFGVEKEGLPGDYFSPNLTPYNLGDWTDGEILRAITSGVSKDGRALFPIMPYPNYAKMNKEDLYSIIAYLRTLESIESETPEPKSYFPMNFIINTIPQKAELTTNAPDTTDPVSWGKYLVNAASCMDCHTPKEKGADIPGMELAGGFEFGLEDGSIVRTANITPDLNTGIGSWTERAFINRFKFYADTSFQFNEITPGQFNTVMPWGHYSQMSEEELKAIYAYLKTTTPVENLVTRFTPVED
ncbi:MAG: cytochrome c [Gracilimonas sp.]|uniref:c-type cytochrome n=1 Tax=Gracilimonas sp. TaxID=1974203 RepID=UPI0019C05C51|nr:c-type cytochrome [Gracilimonas sp.]MBD3615106.1 cytochrome c [Gracilimonas sp.]